MSTLPSTEELQRLLDDATPGPWYLHEDETGDPDGTYLHDAEGVMCIAITPIGSGSDYREDDLDLATLAPVLAAEVIRLREGITDAKTKLDHYVDTYHRQGHIYTSARLRNVSKDLARVVEGDQA